MSSKDKKFVDVEVDILKSQKGEKHIQFKGVSVNGKGDLSLHVADDVTILLNSKFLKANSTSIEEATGKETQPWKAPAMKSMEAEKSTVRLMVINEKNNGHKFVGVKKFKYNPKYRGVEIKADGEHCAIIDGQTLFKETGLRFSGPLSKNTPEKGI